MGLLQIFEVFFAAQKKSLAALFLVNHADQFGVLADDHHLIESGVPDLDHGLDAAGIVLGESPVNLGLPDLRSLDKVVIRVNRAGVVGVGVGDVIHFLFSFRLGSLLSPDTLYYSRFSVKVNKNLLFLPGFDVVFFHKKYSLRS